MVNVDTSYGKVVLSEGLLHYERLPTMIPRMDILSILLSTLPFLALILSLECLRFRIHFGTLDQAVGWKGCDPLISIN